MSSRRQFKTWNIFDSALIKNANGHHYWETKGLVDELMRRGETVRLFSHRIAPTADEFPGVAISPAFSLYLYRSISNDPAWSTLENFVVHNRAFSHELSSLDPVLFREFLVLFPTVGASQLLGIFRWLGGFAPENRPKAAICLIPPGTGSRTDHPEEIYKKVWNSCPPALKEGITLFGRTPQIAKMCATQAGMPLHVYPYPVPDELIAARRSPSPAPGGPWWFRSWVEQDGNEVAICCRTWSNSAAGQGFDSSSRRGMEGIPTSTSRCSPHLPAFRT